MSDQGSILQLQFYLYLSVIPSYHHLLYFLSWEALLYMNLAVLLRIQLLYKYLHMAMLLVNMHGNKREI